MTLKPITPEAPVDRAGTSLAPARFTMNRSPMSSVALWHDANESPRRAHATPINALRILKLLLARLGRRVWPWSVAGSVPPPPASRARPAHCLTPSCGHEQAQTAVGALRIA